MDLSKPKPKKAHPETCNDQESDAAERCRVTETKAPADNDRDQHPRQDVQPKEKQDPPVTPNKSRSKTAATASSSPPARGGMSMPSQIMIMRMPPSVSLSSEDKELLRTADPLPPVTRETLSELDLDRIMRNIHLRTDANFETDLHFKPDLDGEKGLRKRAAADRYWSAVHIEIMAHAISTLNGESVELEVVPVSQLARIEGDWFQPRLPWMFETLQDILKTLVPERDHACVAQNLDVRLLMQQIRKGVLDLARLARWLAELLKMHCAPMRDQDADRMVTEISQGYDTHDMGKVVDGLRTLFGLLEMMKLDVANHQIRAFRVALVEDTIPFLQDYFFRRMATGEFKADDARTWYLSIPKQVTDLSREAEDRAFFPPAVLLRGLCELLLQFDEPASYPQTFQFDLHRLWQLRVTLQHLIHIDVCWSILEHLINRAECRASRRHIYSRFRSRISCLLDTSSDSGSDNLGTRLPNAANVALEIARLAHEARSGHASPKDVPNSLITEAEKSIKRHLATESPVFRHYRGILRHELLTETYQLARKYINMSPLAICESQRARVAAAPSMALGRTQRQREIVVIAMKLAHIGVLHWRVWGPLLYAAASY